MATQAERRETTRQAILGAAAALFGEAGFAATSMDRIAAEAGVAKGAVYHHFPSKEAVFEAVFDETSRALAGEVLAVVRQAPDVLAGLAAGTRAYAAACARGPTRRILLEDGPQVLGWARWRELDARHFAANLPRALERAMAEGLIAAGPVEPLARVLLGAITEASFAAATGGDEPGAYLQALERLIDGLRLR